MERVSSSSNLYDRRKREERLREQEGRLRRRHKRRSVVENEHTLSEKYESLDYEIVENELYRAAEMSKDHQVFLPGFFLLLILEEFVSTECQPMGRMLLDWCIYCISCIMY